ncbi:transposable element Tc1 transposase [Trichonephila clavipes]|nr:transposable element Tc1 transposase [Trichonephila clavipes]
MPLRRRRSHHQKLTEFERDRVIGIRKGGFSFRDIAERLGWNVSTVHDYWEQWSRDGTASRRPGSERPRDTTEREDSRIQSTAVTYRTASAKEIRASVTQRTVRNRLLQRQLRVRRPVACIPLIPRHCRLRRQWCQARAY